MFAFRNCDVHCRRMILHLLLLLRSCTGVYHSWDYRDYKATGAPYWKALDDYCCQTEHYFATEEDRWLDRCCLGGTKGEFCDYREWTYCDIADIIKDFCANGNRRTGIKYRCPWKCDAHAYLTSFSLTNPNQFLLKCDATKPMCNTCEWQTCQSNCGSDPMKYVKMGCTTWKDIDCETCTTLRYDNVYLLPTKNCGPHIDNYAACDACTDPNGVSFPKEANRKRCPAFDPSKGRPPGTDDIANRFFPEGYGKKISYCLPCQTCRGINDTATGMPLYFYQAQAQVKCVTNTKTQCSYTHKDLSGQPSKAREMPFVLGKKRMRGSYSTNINYMNNNPDGLPHYVDCVLAAKGYRLRNISKIPINLNVYNNYIKFDSETNDCDPRYIGECAENYYAKISGDIIECYPCESGGLSLGGLQTICRCPDGYATPDNIREALDNANISQYVWIKPSSDSTNCIHCSNEDIIGFSANATNRNVNFQKERIACSIATGIKRCARDEILDDVRRECKRCPEDSPPSLNKKQCIRCAAGTYSNGYSCITCKGWENEWCPEDGMTAPKLKKESCQEEGKMFVRTMSNTDDNDCQTCDTTCANNMFIVFNAGHNQSNGCSLTESSRKYFACYDGSKSLPPEKYRTIYHYDPITKITNVSIDLCGKYQIPDHSVWVDSPLTGIKKQCVFACTHGWHRQIAEELQLRIHQKVYDGGREDLKEFVDAIENYNVVERTSEVIAEKNVNWPVKVDGAEYDEGWGQIQRVQATYDTSRSRSHRLKNTFLYVDEVMSDIKSNATFMRGLCLDDTESYDTQNCPLGLVSDPILSTDQMQCALDARENGVFNVYDSKGDAIEYTNAVIIDNKIKCAQKYNEDTSRWIPLFLCASCLDKRLVSLQKAMQVGSTERMKLMARWLRRETWSDYYLSKRITLPYDFIKTANCDTRHGGSNSELFTVSLGEGIQASLPCNFTNGVDARAMCQTLFGDSYYYNTTGICSNDSPCVMCGVGNSVESVQEKTWLDIRASWPSESKVCKYRCASRTHTSNRDPAQYPANPCIPCIDIINNFSANGLSGCKGEGAAYYDREEEILEKCGDVHGINEYIPQCSDCTSIMSIDPIFSTNTLFKSNDDCLAICPPDLYRTFFFNESTNQTEETLKPIEQSRIVECRLCVDAHVISCNNSNCSSDYYMNETTCIKCNASQCDEAGYYRTKCKPSSVSDSRCALCDESRLLYNTYEEALRALLASKLTADLRGKLWKALNTSQLDRSRRWLKPSVGKLASSVFVSGEGCVVTCVNNYAWIDFSTGLPPVPDKNHTLQARYVCIPCYCDYLGGQSLYSVWNYSGVLVPLSGSLVNIKALNLMQVSNLTGGCYACPPNTDTIPNVDTMCQAKPGFGIKTQVGVEIEITTISSGDPVIGSGIPVINTMLYTSIRLPGLRPSNNQFFTCCGLKDTKCQIFEKRVLDADQTNPARFNLLCKNNATGANYTRTGVRRLLLEEDQPLEQCMVGQYNHIRGGTTCFNCPNGASTIEPYNEITNRDKCACLPGYYAVRNAVTGALSQCVGCGLNRHRTVYMNDSSCEPCASGMVTPTATSANCYCEAGTYYSNGGCVDCEEGGYCESGSQRLMCPENSWSKHGSKSRSDCICDKSKFYGSLANPGSICYKIPPTMQCENDKCECATGWYPIYNTSADGLTTVMRCLTECDMGQYAVINPTTFQKLECRACPLNTYSSSRQSIFTGDGRQQCTPCPPNFQTLDTGSVSPSQCACISGFRNETTSECGSCPINTFLNTFTRVCEVCPDGAVAPSGSVGYISCACKKGSRSIFVQGSLQCEECPLNTYAASTGFSCTRCPDGMVTMGRGSTSQRYCVCPDGKLNHAGTCI